MLSKNEFVKRYSDLRAITKTAASVEVNAFIKILEDVIADEGGVNFLGFGKFQKVEVAERNGINPKTKEPITIPASSKAKFTAGKTLKDRINCEER